MSMDEENALNHTQHYNSYHRPQSLTNVCNTYDTRVNVGTREQKLLLQGKFYTM